MKNLITGLALLSLLSLCSCTKVVYTHEQVLSRYTNKQEVTKKFGIPTEKKVSDTTEAWLYRYDKHDSFSNHSIDEFPNTQTVTVTDFNRYKRYLVFMFDQKGNMVRYDFQGVDLAVRGKNTTGTIILVSAGALLVAGTIYSTVYIMDEFRIL
jgi:hypothetical protein